MQPQRATKDVFVIPVASERQAKEQFRAGTLNSVGKNVILTALMTLMPILVVERSKPRICSRPLAGNAGSNPVGSMDVL